MPPPDVHSSQQSQQRVFSMLEKVATEFHSELGDDTLCATRALKFNGDECVHPNMMMDAVLLQEARVPPIRVQQGTQLL